MNIVMALDRSRHARAAIQVLQQMCWPTGSTLTLLHVLEIVTISGGWQLHYHPELWKQFVGERRKLLAQAQRFLERMEAQLQVGDTRVGKMVKWGSPLTGILEALKKQQADLVVVGSRGLSGVRRFLLGSVSEGLLHAAPCSVLISRGRGKRRGERSAKGLRILVAVDESEHALAAARWLRALRLPAAEVTILHVVGPPEDCVPQLLTLKAPRFRESAQAVIRMTNERGGQVLKLARKALAYRGLTIHPVLAEGHPAEEIIRTATRSHADLVILGSRGMTGLKGAFLGSVSRRVARHAPCSVLVVKTR
ncbi:MAG: universal stress protein [Nitrospira sp. CG24D]|jgi:nucleotide-binding universal stress UspA family protein|nr:MAG: universal stress protein [Nitrospira sp. CG24D]